MVSVPAKLPPSESRPLTACTIGPPFGRGLRAAATAVGDVVAPVGVWSLQATAVAAISRAAAVARVRARMSLLLVQRDDAWAGSSIVVEGSATDVVLASARRTIGRNPG